MGQRADHLNTPPTQAVVSAFGQNVLAAGGAHLTEPCRPDEFEELALPSEPPAFNCGCGGETRVSVPYEMEDGSTNYVILCAVCDAPYLTPRFEVAL